MKKCVYPNCHSVTTLHFCVFHEKDINVPLDQKEELLKCICNYPDCIKKRIEGSSYCRIHKSKIGKSSSIITRCLMEGCNEKHSAKGLCVSHYYARKYSEEIRPNVVRKSKVKVIKQKVKKEKRVTKKEVKIKLPKECIVDGCCNTKVIAKSLCWKHYQRLRRHGTVELNYKDKTGYVNQHIKK